MRLRMRGKGSSWRHRQAVLLALAKAGAAAALSLVLLLPAGAQFWGPFDNRQPRQQQRQQEFNPFGGGWFGNPREAKPRREQQREAPPDYSRAPSTQRKAENRPATPIVVLGDGMAD